MTHEEKDLLLKDLCSRLPYGVKATTTLNGWSDAYIVTGYNNNKIYLDCSVYDEGDDEWDIESVKPYLRPMSSMTEKEKNEFYKLPFCDIQSFKRVDWLNKNMFDYRGLIEKGLALEAPEEIY